MKLENCKRDRRKAIQGKSVAVSMRISPEASAWLRENSISPTGLFNEAMKELGFKPKDEKIEPVK